jgi:DNA-binding beta-propeller fold protein YncE
LSYTFSGTSAGSINYIRLCNATDNTCASCNVPFRVIKSGTPIPYSTSGTTYSISPAAITAYLQSSGLSAGNYNIGLYVQSTEYNCASSSAYCGTNQDSNSHLLCMNAAYDGATVTTLNQSDNGNAVLNTPEFPLVYVNNDEATYVSLCPVNADGTLGTCVNASNSQATPIPSQRGIVTNAIHTFAYIVSTNNNVWRCPINSNGIFGTCVPSGNPGGVFSTPDDIALNPAGTFAYVSNQLNNRVSICPVNSANGALGPCVNSSNIFSSPFGIIFNSAGNLAYVTNVNSNSVSKCPVNPNGTFGTCVGSGSSGFAFNAPRYITLNNAETVAYVSNGGNSTVSRCPINPDGTFGICTSVGNTGTAFDGPRGIVFNPENSVAYVNNTLSSVVLKCPVNADGTWGQCANASSSSTTLDGPNGLAWSIRTSTS